MDKREEASIELIHSEVEKNEIQIKWQKQLMFHNKMVIIMLSIESITLIIIAYGLLK